jgi:metal-responsive CopG/Arc/MetJ family transcriptional regulator
MITKTKKSVSLTNTLLNELALLNKDSNISEFIEKALAFYMNELKRQERGKRDIEIINTNAKRFKKEAEENLAFQAMK